MFWNCILSKDDPLAGDIKVKIDQIAKILISQVNQISMPTSLMGGETGILNFLFYYSHYTNNTTLLEQYLLRVNDIIELSFKEQNFTFSNGIAGVLWEIDHLQRNNFIQVEMQEMLDVVRTSLAVHTKHYIDNGNYDFLHGALGIGFYFMKTDIEKSKEYLEYLIDKLAVKAEKKDSGIAWESLLIPQQNIKGYNLGLSHGIASILVFLSKVYVAGICKEKIFDLINKATTFLISKQQKEHDQISRFPNWVIDSNPKIQHSRLGWCYGDLGIGIALWITGKNIEDNILMNEAIQILEDTTNRKDLEKNFVYDGALCHGTVGIAHIYCRAYNFTNLNVFKNAAIFWYNETLKMAKFEHGLAGYKKAVKDNKFKNDASLLEGIAGIGLALMAATSFIEPKWDECLLLS